MKQEVNTYEVNLIDKNQLNISGNGDDKLWDNAIILDDFISPWSTEDGSEIIFKALWDREKLFFNFTVFDTEIHIEKQDDSIESINNSDRVELFFRSDASLNPYYCLEIDPSPRVMDFMAHPNKDFDFNWNWPKNDLIVKSSINANSFTVEGSISIESLRSFNLIKNNTIEAGVFRAKYIKAQNECLEPNWITWVNPNTETPNFHIASSFGVFVLKE
ncbi:MULTISPECIES: sugar-binding protein [Flavobacterium]|uniref:Endoxylanase n=1 Tax=Flavobacterium ranwuense TaxID=2541725 RepID=A0ABY2DS96_9FLAO|nr:MULTISPECIES: sugar-binding protein [Flavobacterium]TDE28456.1 endoxylanase [Flavobacterium ranwuense]TDE50066.1 endoxylanase [Flavobacterium sp. GT3P67]